MSHHPVEIPSCKHDLVGVWPLQSSSSMTYFSTRDDIVRVATGVDPFQGSKPKLIATVYTYLNPPDSSICRVLAILGFVDRDVMSTMLGEQVQNISIGVKRADGDHRFELDPGNVKNSNEFAKFMSYLFKKDCVAVLKLDKLGRRVGFLMPWVESEVGVGLKGSYAGVCTSCNVDDLQSASSSTSHLIREVSVEQNSRLWQPPGGSGDLWQPPSESRNDQELSAFAPETFNSSMDMSTSTIKRKRSLSQSDEEDQFHKDEGAAAADRFYSGLTRDLDTRADSRLFHMRSFNGWVKATQIMELKPSTKSIIEKKGLRILDLACGKGGDLGKFSIHSAGVANYVGIDVARGSLRDAAKRVSALPSGKLRKASFICADLGSDVPGSRKSKYMLETWIMSSTTVLQDVPRFNKVLGGGISPSDKFDVVSIQFAIHYMMSTEARARRFFKTVGNLLDVGGSLIATTIDARIICWHLMDLGLNLNELNDNEQIVVSVGNGVCTLKFEPSVVKRLFGMGNDERSNDSKFGLQYSFTLSEGDDHAAGVGKAVDLPEWLTPIPVIEEIANEAGLRLDYHENFHEFFANRSDPKENPIAHNALYNMKVLDRTGSISQEEWDISRLYAAIKFTKVKESSMPASDDEDEAGEPVKNSKYDNKLKMMEEIKLAKSKAEQVVGSEKWKVLSSKEKNDLMKEELKKIKEQ